MSKSSMHFISAICALALASAGAGCGRGTPEVSVLVVTVDSLRADRLGCYGYERKTTPALDALAEESVLFERAYSHAPFTAPSHASLLTSQHIPSHGVYAWAEALDPRSKTLGDRFGAVGFRTGAFYNHPGLRTSEVTRGFDEVQERFYEEADRTIDSFFQWLDAGDGSAPFAGWMHLWDVHRPYAFRDYSSEFVRPFVDREPSELTLAFGEERFGEPHDRVVGRTERYYNLSEDRRTGQFPTSRGSRPLSEADLRYIEDRYDGGVAYTDEALGRLVEGLRERDLLDSMVLVVTADHGESLTEREACYFTHDPFVYEETLRVPLLVRLPGGEFGGTRVEELGRHVDVLPTLLEMCDLPLDDSIQGRSLMPDVRGQKRGPAPLFAQTQTRNAKEFKARSEPDGEWLEHRLAITVGTDKLIRDENADSWSFFDLDSDPGETRDLAEEPFMRERLVKLRDLYFTLQNGLPKAGDTSVEMDPELEAQMKALGYHDGEGED